MYRVRYKKHSHHFNYHLWTTLKKGKRKRTTQKNGKKSGYKKTLYPIYLRIL
jgi:hypothetical protein